MPVPGGNRPGRPSGHVISGISIAAAGVVPYVDLPGRGIHFLLQGLTNGTRAGKLSDFGGRREEGDNDAVFTAARELCEETGARPSLACRPTADTHPEMMRAAAPARPSHAPVAPRSHRSAPLPQASSSATWRASPRACGRRPRCASSTGKAGTCATSSRWSTCPRRWSPRWTPPRRSTPPASCAGGAPTSSWAPCQRIDSLNGCEPAAT